MFFIFLTCNVDLYFDHYRHNKSYDVFPTTFTRVSMYPIYLDNYVFATGIFTMCFSKWYKIYKLTNLKANIYIFFFTSSLSTNRPLFVCLPCNYPISWFKKSYPNHTGTHKKFGHIFTFWFSITESSYCNTPSDEEGECISVYKCQPLLALINKKDRTSQDVNLLKKSQCGYDGKAPAVSIYLAI